MFSLKKFPAYFQPDEMDCGPTCLRILLKHYGSAVSLKYLRNLCQTSRDGTSMLNICLAATKLGFNANGIRCSYHTLTTTIHLPCIVHWRYRHFVVVYKIKHNKVYVSDPAIGLICYDKKDFIANWIGLNAHEYNDSGNVLLLEKQDISIIDQEEEEVREDNYSFTTLLHYLSAQKKLLLQLFLGLLIGIVIQFMLPLLTKSIVDVGIQNKDIHFIYLILLFQLFLFIGRASVEMVRGWIFLYLSTRIGISMLTAFFVKLMSLPISFFDTRLTGDIMQRISDNNRLHHLLTVTLLNTIFSFTSIIVFGWLLAFYNIMIFLVFMAGSGIYIGWILLFLKKRKLLDHKKFYYASQEQSKIIELINGMQEIKLHNATGQKRAGWEHIQARLFKIRTGSLSLDQTLTIGGFFINELKNIMVMILAAMLVIKGEISLGSMLSISYITGQLSAPISQVLTFIQSFQDTKISIERLGIIYNKESETTDTPGKQVITPESNNIELKQVSFRYTSAKEPVLKNLTLTIPANKVTAIVGASGGGKTTLLKVLLNFYDISEGSIRVGNTPLKDIDITAWREACGVVMQEGYIFNDTIANNIALGCNEIDEQKLQQAIAIANLSSFIDELQSGVHTKIGMEGAGISTGQKQRMLIARAVYKDPAFIFFDEATSALDTRNENTIMQNLQRFFKNKTVVIIAHRLSTVKNADQIVVLENGAIAEIGTHYSLTKKGGAYYNLISNQLEMENLAINGKK